MKYDPRKTVELEKHLANAEAAILYIDGKEFKKFKYFPSGWKSAEMYARSSSETPQWTKLTKDYHSTFMLLEIIEHIINMGYKITDVKTFDRKGFK